VRATLCGGMPRLGDRRQNPWCRESTVRAPDPPHVAYIRVSLSLPFSLSLPPPPHTHHHHATTHTGPPHLRCSLRAIGGKLEWWGGDADGCQLGGYRNMGAADSHRHNSCRKYTYSVRAIAVSLAVDLLMVELW
jgi:hypothetical protein